ncbi:MAG: ribosome silencing factor [Syntrophales bacterium]|nr:ribosome silencing factor [Syntrophales bacterium]MDD5231779.1 ribosome silencing factor [Syntrophales bacterium]HPL63875.1 ribosome silencing factor [Syntrophales bacterium]
MPRRSEIPRKISSRKLVLLSANAALEKKATNLIILNVKEMSSLADYFVICSGNSDRQVQAISSAIEEVLKKAGRLPIGVEGERAAKWVLMDYGDVIFHIFYEPVRSFYDIERLWTDVPRMEVGEDVSEISSLRKGM